MLAVKPTNKRSSSLQKTRGLQYFVEPSLKCHTDKKKPIVTPLNTWRNLNYCDLLRQAMELLEDNHEVLKDKNKVVLISF